MSIQSEIERISEAKNTIKSAIISKGVDVGDDVLIDGYAEKISAISSGGIKTTELTLNGPKGFSPAISVSVPVYNSETGLIDITIASVSRGSTLQFDNCVAGSIIYCASNSPSTIEGGYVTNETGYFVASGDVCSVQF